MLRETAKTPKDAATMKQLVFQRINSGGVQLEFQETRNALLDGPMNRLCLELSSNKYLRILFQIDEDELEDNKLYSTMGDVELVLRFFAMRQLEGYAKRKLQNYLDYYLKGANNYDEVLLNQLKGIFENTIKFAYDLLGEQAFFMFRSRDIGGETSWNYYQRATTTIYDPLMQVLSSVLDNRDKLIACKDQIKEDLKKFYKTNYDVFEGRNNNKADIERRMYYFMDFLSDYLRK